MGDWNGLEEFLTPVKAPKLITMGLEDFYGIPPAMSPANGGPGSERSWAR